MSQLKSLVSEQIVALSLAAHRDEEGARFALELIVKPFGVKPGKNLAWNNVGKKFAAKVKDMSDADIGLALAQAPHDLVAERLGIEITKEIIPAGEETPDGSVELSEEIRAIDEPSPALEHAIANAHATLETIEEAIQAEPDPVKREEVRVEEPELLMHNILVDGRQLGADWMGKGWNMGFGGKVNVTLPLPKETTTQELAAAYKAWQEGLVREVDTKRAHADMLSTRTNVNALNTAISTHLSKNVKFSDEVGKARLFLSKERDAALQALGAAQRGMESKNAKDLLPVGKVQELITKARQHGGNLQALAVVWSVECEKKFEVGMVSDIPAPKVINKPAQPATQPPKTGGQEKKPMEKIAEIKAALEALKQRFNGLSPEAKKYVQKDFFKNVSVIDGHIKGNRLDKALSAVEGQEKSLDKAVAATTPTVKPDTTTPPTVEPTVEPTPDATTTPESRKEEFLGKLFAQSGKVQARFTRIVLVELLDGAPEEVKSKVNVIADIVCGLLDANKGTEWAPLYGPLLMLNDDEDVAKAMAPAMAKLNAMGATEAQAKVLGMIDEAAKQVAFESNVTTTPANEPVDNKEIPVSKPKSNVETTSQRAARKAAQNPTPASEPAQQAGQTPATKENPVTPNNPKQEKPVLTKPVTPFVASQPITPTAEQYAAIAKDEKTVKVMGPKPVVKKLKSTILGGIRCALHNFDQRMQASFGPLPGSKEFGKLAESLKDACGGEEKALISPKGKGDAKDALVRGMNVLVEASAAAKHRMFTVKVNGKDVHAPTRILELEGVIKTLKNGERQVAERELSELYTKRDESSAKWGTDAAQASASMMRDALKALTPEDAAKLAINLQTLGNYGVVRNLPEGEGRFIIKGFKPEITIERVKELATPYAQAEGLKVTDEVIKGIKERVESIKTDADYQRLLADVALLRAQIARLLKAEKDEEKKIEDMQQKSMQLAIVGGIIDEMRVGSTAPTLNGWGMVKENAPVWTRDHDLLVSLILAAKDGEHPLPGCGEDKRETVGHLAASILVTFAYGVEPADGGSLICHEWQTVLDGIKNAKALEEQVAKPGFRGYARQLVWGLYVGTRWLVLRIVGVIDWALCAPKGAYYGLKALGLYGVSLFSKDSEGYKASAKVALEKSGKCFKDIALIPWNGAKGIWNSLFGKKTAETTDTAAVSTTAEKESDMKSTFVKNIGLEGIMSYPFGKEPKDLKADEKSSLGAKWDDQTTGQKVATVVTLPFRAVKRVVVAQTAISVGVIAGGVAAGVVGSMVLGTVGLATAGAVVAGAVVGGLLGWGVKALFAGKDKKVADVKAPEAPKAAAPVAPVAAPVAAPAQQAAA